MSTCNAQITRKFSWIRVLVLFLFAGSTHVWAEISVPEYCPDGVIRTTNARLEMTSSGVIQLYDKNNVRHDIHLAMNFQVGGWFTPGSLADRVISTNSQTRTTMCSATIIPPVGSVDTTPIPMRYYMQLLDNEQIRVAAEFDTPLSIYDILSSCEIKDHVRPRSAFWGHDVSADGTPYLISDNDPNLGTVVLETAPIDHMSLMDDVADQNVQFTMVDSKSEYLIDRDFASNAHIETKIAAPIGTVNRVEWKVTFPQEVPAMITADPVYQSDGRIISGSTSLVMSSGGEIKLVDNNGTTYSIHLSMGFIVGPGWFTLSYSDYVTDGQVTTDITNKKTSFTGNIQPPPGSADLTPIPVEFYMQIQADGSVRIKATFDRSGSIYDILSSCDLKAHIRPHSGFVGHIIDADGTEFPITNEPPTSSSTTANPVSALATACSV